ncbi:unnamed protein product [Lactuca virosa]|uniref:Uncharacterized protein n=1 Tax=Lactuca virosa TaxID=75947 RepID=A0AAU9M8F6_9ASTR|nr:unnamed protein product [Lactuca virosa]
MNAPHLVDSNAYVDSNPYCISLPTRKDKRLLRPHQLEHFLREVLGTPLCMSSSSSDHPLPVIAEGSASCLLVQEAFDEACRSIAHVETGISTVHGMRLVGEKMLLKTGGMLVELFGRYHAAPEKIVMLENQRSLLQSDYQACLHEKDILHA